MTTDVSSETMEARGQWNDAFDWLKGNPVDPGSIIRGRQFPSKVKTFSD